MTEPKKILVIEDLADTRGVITAALTSVGYRVFEAESVAMGVHLFQTQKPELVILDIKLPDGSGLEVCRKIRSHKALAATPVIMLTGNTELDDKQSGFEAGADQYLSKPVHPKELLLWVQALLKRIQYDKEEGDELQAGELALHLKSHVVRHRDQVIGNLTVREYDLLYMLVKKRPQVLTRKYILSVLWHTVAMDHLVDSHISNLRKKLPTEISDKIQNVPGKGFRYFG